MTQSGKGFYSSVRASVKVDELSKEMIDMEKTMDKIVALSFIHI